MQTTAAVMRAHNAPLSIETIQLDDPRPGEVLIRMTAAGICGSDRHVLEGHFPGTPPCVGGHEGAGVVEKVGDGVQGISVGDHVVHLFVGPCGECLNCRNGRKTYCTLGWTTDGALPDGTFRMRDAAGANVGTLLGLGSFSRHTVSPARNVAVVPDGVDPLCAALVSCGVSTGVGAAVNVARTQLGDDVAVIGVGGVGAAAIMGAVAAGAARVIAVDVFDSKESSARAFGATHFVNAARDDAVEKIREATGGKGAERVLLTVDNVRAEQYALAIDAVAHGGAIVQVGAHDHAITHLPISPTQFTYKQATFTGTVYGGMDPARDVARWIALFEAGRLPLEKLITRTYSLDEINDAFADLAAGRNIRGVVTF